jgi:cobalt-zinc-cadmium efflux system membrane fusion protein
MKKWTFPFGILLLGGGVLLGGYLMGWDKARATVEQIEKTIRRDLQTKDTPVPVVAEPRTRKPFDGAVELTPEQLKAVGVTEVEAKAQTEPTYLDVNGATAYNPNTLTPVRSRFQCLVSKVYVQVGDVVHKGDPIVDLFSTDLAQAKSTYEVGLAQWTHDSAQLARLEPLYKQKAISEKDYFDAYNDEQKSRLMYKVARDNLIVYGLSDNEINSLEKEEGSRKARMTLHSPADGLVITRDVVEGSLYDTTNVLVTIAPQDKLWVLGNVYESDQDKIHVGQPWEIRFPFLADVLSRTIEHVDMRVNPTTKTIQIRTTIPNPGGKFKADMLVRGKVALPPQDGRTIVPRQAVILQGTEAHVFVRDPNDPSKFRRKNVVLAQESHDQVIIAQGLTPGERVVDRGSLILSQMYEDLSMTDTGLPL